MLEFDIEPSSVKGHYRGILRGRLTPRIYDVFQGLPGRKRLKDGIYYFEWSNSNVEYLSLKFPEVRWSDKAEEKRRDIVRLREVERERRAAKFRPPPPEAEAFPFKTVPFKHQLQAFHFSKEIQNFGLFMEQGTGKTKVLIDTAAFLFSQGGEKGTIDCLLVVAPNGVHSQWVTEQCPIHMPDFIPWKGAYYESSPNKIGRERIAEVLDYTGGLKVITVHIEALSSPKGESFLRSVLLRNRCLFVVDESSRIKNPSAKRTKSITALAPLAPYRRIATGTPITQGVEDIYAQFQFLDNVILGHNSFYSFQHRYCVTQSMNFGARKVSKIVGYQNVDELTERIEGHTFRVRKEDCLDLPDKLFVDYTVDLTPNQWDQYQQLRKELYLELANKVITAPLAVTKILRLQQILSGFVPDPETGEAIRLETNRVVAAINLIEESSSKVIVWTRFREDIRQLQEALDKAKIGYVTYTGETPQHDRVDVIERFKSDDSVKVFLSNPKTAGTGLNLTVASTVIWYTADFSLESYLQANDRVHRIGQTNKVTYYQLQSPHTVDQKIYRALAAKKNLADMIVDPRELLE